MSTKPLTKIAITGASGRIGGYFARALLATGTHTVTALTHANSKPPTSLPSGITTVLIDYSDESTLISALQGQQFLIITLGVRAPPDLQTKLITAALKAGVPYIMPNLYGFDFSDAQLHENKPAGESLFNRASLDMCLDIQSRGAAYIAMVCGYWYEWSLALGEPWFGFDVKNRTVTFYDDGMTKISSSTWEQCGRAVAGLLNLPETSGGEGPAVSDWKNKILRFDSFVVSQRDMLDSLNRVLGTGDGDWVISYEKTPERYERGLKMFKEGNILGFATAIYAKIFYQGGVGDFSEKGLANEVLGLPKEDLDEATKRALGMVDTLRAEMGFTPA